MRILMTSRKRNCSMIELAYDSATKIDSFSNSNGEVEMLSIMAIVELSERIRKKLQRSPNFI